MGEGSWGGGEGGLGEGAGDISSTLPYILHYHMVLRPEGTSHNEWMYSLWFSSSLSQGAYALDHVVPSSHCQLPTFFSPIQILSYLHRETVSEAVLVASQTIGLFWLQGDKQNARFCSHNSSQVTGL